jgi:hypothetical protein
MATLTGHSRQIVRAGTDFNWSRQSWTHNTFRAYEVLFGRRYGIRAEGFADSKGNVYSYTWENYVAVIESMMRAALKLKLPRFSIVRIPEIQLAGLGRLGVSPFRFAIAFDNSNTVGFAFVTTQSFSLTITGSNTLVVGAARSASGSDSVTGMTYNGVALSNGTSVVVPSDRGTCMKYLKGPATGANTFSATSSVSGFLLLAASYTGALQTGGMDASTTKTGASVTTQTTTLTTIAANCIVILYSANSGQAQTAGAGATFRATVNTDYIFDSNGPVPAGSYSMTTTFASDNNATNMISFAPVASATIVHSLMSMGMGS